MGKILFTVILMLITTFLPLRVHGAAFFLYNQDAKANGMGMAASASIDNPSAVFYNPAMIVFQGGFGGSLGDTIVMSETSYKDQATGQKTNAKSKTHHLPTLFLKHTKENVSFGLGIFSPFGLSTEWPSGWIGRYVSTYAEIRTTYINPVIAYKLTDYLSFGIGGSYVKSSVEFKNAINLSSMGMPDGIAKLTGDGDGYGYNAAVAIKLPDDFSVALTYRSPTEIRYDGDARFYLPTPLPSSGTGASTRITLPFVATGGIAKTFGSLTLEVDILFTGWSSMGSYTVSSDTGQANRFIYKDWRNTPSYAFGANYRINPNIEVRGGYMYDVSPVPKKTMSPELPDASRNILTLGAGYRKDGLRIDLAYQATFFYKADSTMSMTGPRGTYDNFAHLILIGVTYMR